VPPIKLRCAFPSAPDLAGWPTKARRRTPSFSFLKVRIVAATQQRPRHSRLQQQLRQLGDIRRDPARLVVAGKLPTARLARGFAMIYSIMSSAQTSTDEGTVKPSAPPVEWAPCRAAKAISGSGASVATI